MIISGKHVVCGTEDLTGERRNDRVSKLVLESVKQLVWPGLPAEMTVVTGERSWGGGLTVSISKQRFTESLQ